MRELHVVAVSEDGRHVLLAGQRGATKGGFRVALDDRLAAAVRGDLPRPGEAEPHASELTPKEIQARLRAGESAASIAAAAGVPVSRVERFSGPVQGEMARVLDAARGCHLVRGRLGRSAVPLGAAVDAALAGTPSLREDSVDWSTRREEDGTWLVTVTWFARARSRAASWRWDPATKTVAAVDPASAALGHVDPDPAAAARTARRAAAPAAKPSAKPAAKPSPKPTAKPTPRPAAKTARGPVTQAAKATARAAARPAPAAKPAARPAARPTAKPSTRAAAPAPASKARPAKAPAAAPLSPRRRALQVVPDPEPAPSRQSRSGPPRPAARKTATGKPAGARTGTSRSANERDGVKTRASVPGWADVLLGTSPGGER